MTYTRTIIELAGGLRVERYAPQHPGIRPPMVFAHGIFHGSWLWWNFMDYFASRGSTCYGLNYRGHFLSSGHDRLGLATVEDYVADVHTALAAVGEEAVLVGHSMGGVVSQKAAESARLHRLVLLDSAPCRELTETVLEVPAGRRESTRTGFAHLPDGTSIMARSIDTVRAMLFERNKVSDEVLWQTFAFLGRESTRVLQEHAFTPVSPEKITCPVYVLGRTGFGNSKNPDLWSALADYLGAAGRSIRGDISHNMMCETDWQEHARLLETWCFA